MASTRDLRKTGEMKLSEEKGREGKKEKGWEGKGREGEGEGKGRKFFKKKAKILMFLFKMTGW